MGIRLKVTKHARAEFAYLGWSWFCVEFAMGTGESARDVQLHLSLLGLCAWFSVTLPRALDGLGRGRHGGNEVRLSLSWDRDSGGRGLHLRWRLWLDEHSWHSDTPKWRDFSIDLLDVAFGKTRYEERDVRAWSGPILMPEGAYDATVKVFDSRWSRPRWPRALDVEMRRVTVDCPTGIDHDGKGPLFGLTCRGDGVSDGIAKFVANVVEDRVPGRMYEHRKPRDQQVV